MHIMCAPSFVGFFEVCYAHVVWDGGFDSRVCLFTNEGTCSSFMLSQWILCCWSNMVSSILFKMYLRALRGVPSLSDGYKVL